MSLDAIAFGFNSVRDETNPDLTLAEIDAGERQQIASDVVAALGGSEISADDINLLLNNANNLTVDQAIAYMYQMLSLVDTDASTEDIELGGETFETALATALGIEDEDGDGSTDNEVSEELGDIAGVFAAAEVTLTGVDEDLSTASVDNDRIELNFSNNDDIPSIFDDLNDSTIETLGFEPLDSGTATDGVVSWGYIPADAETPDLTGGEVGVIDDETGLGSDQVIVSGTDAGTATDDDETGDAEVEEEVVEEAA